MQVPGPERRITRAQIVRRAAVGVAAGFVATGVRSQAEARGARDRDRVVVIGAGGAGLTCAYRLLQHGIHASVYEASDRVGGSIDGAVRTGERAARELLV